MTKWSQSVRIIRIRNLNPAVTMDDHPPKHAQPARRPTPGPQPLDSARLFDGREEVLILHGGETYRLRRTRQGKLILTK